MADLAKTVSVETIPVIAYQGARVLTTELLAQLYGAEPINIQQNYANNKDRFVAGKHFFKLEGEELKEFKRLSCLDNIESASISPFARNLPLWTERGIHIDALNCTLARADAVAQLLAAACADLGDGYSVDQSVIADGIWTLCGLIDTARTLTKDA